MLKKIFRLIFIVSCIFHIPVPAVSIPVLTIDGITGDSGTVTVNYTVTDTAEYSLYTIGWQYSLDDLVWEDIDEEQIGNNGDKPAGSSYITWCSTAGINNLAGISDGSVWLRAKAEGCITGFTVSANTLPVPIKDHSTVYAEAGDGPYLLVTGGLVSDTQVNTIYLVKLNADGSISSIGISAEEIPLALSSHSTCTANDGIGGPLYIYITGGKNGATLSEKVYTAEFGGTDMAPLSETTAFSSKGMYDHCAIGYNRCVYIIGGMHEVYSRVNWTQLAELRDTGDGNLEAFNSTQPLPFSLSAHSAALLNDCIYVSGGLAGESDDYSDIVLIARIVPINYSIDTYEFSENLLPEGLAYHASAIGNGYLYITGGQTASELSDKIYYAEINADGTIGKFRTSVYALPAPLRDHTATFVNDHLYIIGGSTSGGSVNTVQYALCGPVTSEYAVSPSFAIDNTTAGEPVPDDLNKVKIYPNPFNPGEHAEGLIFEGIPEGSTIRIFDISGKNVMTVLDIGLDGKATWDCRDKEGRTAAGGVYIAYIENGSDKIIRIITVVR